MSSSAINSVSHCRPTGERHVKKRLTRHVHYLLGGCGNVHYFLSKPGVKGRIFTPYPNFFFACGAIYIIFLLRKKIELAMSLDTLVFCSQKMQRDQSCKIFAILKKIARRCISPCFWKTYGFCTVRGAYGARERIRFPFFDISQN